MKILERRSINRTVIYLLIKSIILIILIGCAIQPAIFEDFERNVAEVGNIKYLCASGTVLIENRKGGFKSSFLRFSPGVQSFHIKYQFKTKDSLDIQINDILGRKFMALKFYNDECMIWMQRGGRVFSGCELPDEFSNYPISLFRFDELRYIILGLPLFDAGVLRNRKESIIETHCDDGKIFKYHINEVALKLNKIEILSDVGNLIGVVNYKNYRKADGLYVPSDILIYFVGSGTSIEIHLSNFSADFDKFGV